MDRGELDDKRTIGSVKAAIGMYGERILEGNSTLKNPQMDLSERPSSRTREVHVARRDIGLFNGSKIVAESIKAQAESELANAKKTVRDLTSRIEEFNSKAKAQMRDLESLRKPERGEEEWALAVRNIENYQYTEVMRELEYVKQELSNLKLDMASVLVEKNRAEKETPASSSRLWSYSSSSERLRKEIEEVNEEQVIIELARIEAVKELEAIQAQRKEEENQNSSAMESTKKIMNHLLQEIERVKDLETKLAITTSDVNMLQNEMDKRVRRNENRRHHKVSSHEEEELDSPLALQSVNEELEAAKKELALIKEEAFQFMVSMDFIKDELKRVYEETYQFKQTEKKADVNVRTLNSKLLRAKGRLEAVSAAEIKAKTIASNSSLTRKQLETEVEAAKKERELICKQITNIKMEVQKIESEIELAEERFQAAMQELEAVKSSESKALDNLKSLIENTTSARASASNDSSTITILSFEYEYLTRRAAGAEEIADRKVAAAQAWIEALKASEKEILMETEMGHRKIREERAEKDKETHKTEKSLSLRRVVEGEVRNWREGEVSKWREKNEKGGNSAPARKARIRKSASPAIGCMSRSGSMTVRRRKKIMPNLVEFFSSKSIEVVDSA